MNLLERISLVLLYIAVHKTPPESRTQDKPQRKVNLDASLDEGVRRARNRRYVPRGDE